MSLAWWIDNMRTCLSRLTPDAVQNSEGVTDISYGGIAVVTNGLQLWMNEFIKQLKTNFASDGDRKLRAAFISEHLEERRLFINHNFEVDIMSAEPAELDRARI